jgi:hypothetical protein
VLNKVSSIDLPKDNLRAAFGYSENYQVYGIKRVDSDKIEKAKAAYGAPSIDDFIAMLVTQKQPYPIDDISKPKPHAVVVLPEKILTPLWAIPLLKQLGALRQRADASRMERDHENVVAEFFKQLGYQPIEEIVMQTGRVDIQVHLGKERIVVEVKRDWNLDKKNVAVIEQAYRYANRPGSSARYVIITNGDYYAFYDRDKGRDYDANFQRDFRLTKLTKADVDFIESRLFRTRFLDTLR